jgi:hypothetical protein
MAGRQTSPGMATTRPAVREIKTPRAIATRMKTTASQANGAEKRIWQNLYYAGYDWSPWPGMSMRPCHRHSDLEG